MVISPGRLECERPGKLHKLCSMWDLDQRKWPRERRSKKSHSIDGVLWKRPFSSSVRARYLYSLFQIYVETWNLLVLNSKLDCMKWNIHSITEACPPSPPIPKMSEWGAHNGMDGTVAYGFDGVNNCADALLSPFNSRLAFIFFVFIFSLCLQPFETLMMCFVSGVHVYGCELWMCVAACVCEES